MSGFLPSAPHEETLEFVCVDLPESGPGVAAAVEVEPPVLEAVGGGQPLVLVLDQELPDEVLRLLRYVVEGLVLEVKAEMINIGNACFDFFQ